MDGSADQGGRVFFSHTDRSLMEEDVVELTSVGVDIGSSTSHMAISRITLERLDSRYVIAGRELIFESDILLTPYAGGDTIDDAALGRFFDGCFDAAGIAAEEIDTGALILTGVAVRRKNARAVGELFAGQAGKFVAVSAGDALETVMAAHGSGALARSIRDGHRVMNVDMGGGTAKIALCEQGEITAMTAIDVGARLVVVDGDERVIRLEDAGCWFARDCGMELALGETLHRGDRDRLAARMAERLFEAMGGKPLSGETRSLLRLDPLNLERPPDLVVFSGGVSEFLGDGHEQPVGFGDLGPALAREITDRVGGWGVPKTSGAQGIRATVVGASQYTVQVSGSTIYLSDENAVPLRNVAVVAPQYDGEAEILDEATIAAAVTEALVRLDLQDGHQPVAVCLRWGGSASFQRLHGLASGVVNGLGAVLAAGHPLVMVTDGDIGGLLGIHCREELGLAGPIISIDGVELKEFDFIDIGAFLKQTGAVPVVIKSLVFPGEA